MPNDSDRRTRRVVCTQHMNFSVHLVVVWQRQIAIVCRTRIQRFIGVSKQRVPTLRLALFVSLYISLYLRINFIRRKKWIVCANTYLFVCSVVGFCFMSSQVPANKYVHFVWIVCRCYWWACRYSHLSLSLILSPFFFCDVTVDTNTIAS